MTDLAQRSSPTQIPGTEWNWINFGQQSFGIKTDGTLWAWGIDTSGGLGLNDGAGGDRSSPTQIPGTEWATVSNGNYHTIATKTDGTMWMWGSSGRIPTNDAVNCSSPIQLPGTQWVYGVCGEDDVMLLKNA